MKMDQEKGELCITQSRARLEASNQREMDWEFDLDLVENDQEVVSFQVNSVDRRFSFAVQVLAVNQFVALLQTVKVAMEFFKAQNVFKEFTANEEPPIRVIVDESDDPQDEGDVLISFQSAGFDQFFNASIRDWQVLLPALEDWLKAEANTFQKEDKEANTEGSLLNLINELMEQNEQLEAEKRKEEKSKRKSKKKLKKIKKLVKILEQE